jgi:hypothetical protein
VTPAPIRLTIAQLSQWRKGRARRRKTYAKAPVEQSRPRPPAIYLRGRRIGLLTDIEFENESFSGVLLAPLPLHIPFNAVALADEEVEVALWCRKKMYRIDARVVGVSGEQSGRLFTGRIVLSANVPMPFAPRRYGVGRMAIEGFTLTPEQIRDWRRRS